MVHRALKKHANLFAWMTYDMSRVCPITHKLSIYKEAQPIAQKKRKLGEEKRLAGKEKVDKLLSANFI